jgi:hypothetical protein
MRSQFGALKSHSKTRLKHNFQPELRMIDLFSENPPDYLYIYTYLLKIDPQPAKITPGLLKIIHYIYHILRALSHNCCHSIEEVVELRRKPAIFCRRR